ncbi:regulator of microtubule dynamics protein 1-like [Lytechinus variegatus]|uniref:regulator of microtubule dynamics protein 1-like n=1 Tax=Lytechinus variegatus TaxID=7654 RepID=UPI001BB1D6E5|nr:regulator of microtubule dynamics protein 1-like [Lytechinus variegatus]
MSESNESAPMAEPEVTAAAEEADRLYSANKSTEMYDHLIRFKDTTHDELLWRLARACWSVGQLASTSKDEKKKLTFDLHDFAQRALKANDQNFASHKWYAISLSEIGEYKGTKEKIENAFTIKDHFVRAIELNPQDATSIHLLGRWYFTFADMGWIQRNLAATVFATPPSGTYDEAIEQFLHAEKVKPNFYSKNLLWLGNTYLKKGDKTSARTYLEKAVNYPVETDEDKEVVKQAEQHLKSL